MVSRSNKQYGKWLFISLLLFTWLLVVCFVWVDYRREHRFKTAQLNTSLQQYNLRINDAITYNNGIERFLKDHPHDTVRVTLIDFNGKVLFDSQIDTPHHNHADRTEFKQAMNRGAGFTVRRLSESANTEYFYSATRVDSAVIRSAIPYTVSLSNILNTNNRLLWFIAGVTLLISVIGFWVMRRISHSNRDWEMAQQELLRGEQDKIRLKRQLTNNINHELKTPVSAIQGYLETILANPQMDDNTRNKFLENSYTQTKRLTELLKDIATLTRLDEGGEQINRERVVLNTIIDEVRTSISVRSPMRLNCDITKELVVFGNSSMLQSIFANLADNAVSYSGGRDIFISLIKEDTTHYHFSFADNGIGVEEEYLPMLFERFYRVDKGRSRKIGGTGLGLSIVRNAVLFHGGEIEVRTRPEGGLIFTFSISKGV